MSGDSYDYFYFKLDQFIEQVSAYKEGMTPKRKKFMLLLMLVSEACHDIEWVDSGDYAPGDEDAAIDEVFKFLSSEDRK